MYKNILGIEAVCILIVISVNCSFFEFQLEELILQGLVALSALGFLFRLADKNNTEEI